MGKKSKRSRKSGGGGGDNTSIVSDSDMSNSINQTSSSTTNNDTDDGSKRKPPALRSVNEGSTKEMEETADNLQCEDPYEDIYEEEEEDDDNVSYEDVYESSGDEEEDEYMEAMAIDGNTTAASQQQQQKNKAPPSINKLDGTLPTTQVKSYNPFLGNSNMGSEPLEMDETAYKMHHALTPEWPSLTLDIMPDKHLGLNSIRTRFPHTVTMVVGSQADSIKKNKISVLRMSDLCRIPGSKNNEKSESEIDDEMLGEEWKHDVDNDDNEESDDSDEEEEEEERDPILEHYSFPHSNGGINRIRICPQNTDIVSVWGDNGDVSLYDVGGAIDVLDRSSLGSAAASSTNLSKKKDDNTKQQQQVRKMRKDPFFVYSGHSTEGYAIDWSHVTPGRMATADCDGNIHIWNATHPIKSDDIVAKYGSSNTKSSPWSNTSFDIKPTYSAHGANLDNPSVEDLQWSPTEATVLASAECGGYVRVYDIRCPNKAMISNRVHDSGADVNVISWNRLVGNLLASGGDDGKLLIVEVLLSFDVYVSQLTISTYLYIVSKLTTSPT